MAKRILITLALLVCAIPLSVQAASWFLGTQARTSGGMVYSPNISGQIVSDGLFFRSYTTQGPLGITVMSKPGYTIRNVYINEVPQPLADSRYFSTTVQGWNRQTGEMTDQVVTASFMPSSLWITATNKRGSVTPSRLSSITYGYTLTSPLTFYFTPAYGYEISNIKNLPVSPLVTHSALPGGANQPVTVTFGRGYMITQTIDLEAEVDNVSPYLTPILPKSVTTGTSGIKLAASVSNNRENRSYDFSWSYVSGPANTTSYKVVKRTVYVTETPGPAVSLLRTDAREASFTAPETPGQYKFKVTASTPGQPDLSAVAVVNVLGTSAAPLRRQCQFCHSVNSIGGNELFRNWSSSAHGQNRITCENCHAGASGRHPGTTDGNLCRNCHVGSDGNVKNHTVAISKASCTNCHDPHTGAGVILGASPEHFNNITTAGYPASYVTSGAHCADCHDSTVENGIARGQWAGSGHAATREAPWMAQDFKTLSGCVQCHTSTGFIAYSTGRVTAAWGSAENKTKEVLTCSGCHSDVPTGAVRKMAPVRPFDVDPYLNHDFGVSNICVACHSGTNSGASIKSLQGRVNFGNTSFIPPHDLAAGAILQGTGGYHFSQRGYAFYSSNSHRLVGMGNESETGTSGPCVACHMSGNNRHLFQVLRVDGSGDLALDATVCANCHKESLETMLAARQQGYQNALQVLRAMLALRGFVFSSEYPYLRNQIWGVEQIGSDRMGAAFNYKLLLSEPGAYAHNAAYTKKLIADSIDLLYNGRVTGSVGSAVSFLLDRGVITKEMADKLSGYLAS